MDPLIASSLIGGGVQFLSGVGSGIAGAISAAKNREWNEKMWHMQNEYNSPSAQMQRLKAAGLNENLMYGQMSSSNAGPVGSADVYNSKGLQDAINHMELASTAAKVAQAWQEVKGKKIENELAAEQLDEYKNKRFAEQEWANQFSDYADYMRKNGYELHYLQNGSTIWSKPGDPLNVSQDVLKFKTAEFLLNQIKRDMQKIDSGIDVNRSKIQLNNSLQTLRTLDVPFLQNRNMWQNWLNGIGAGSKALKTVLPFINLFLNR